MNLRKACYLPSRERSGLLNQYLWRPCGAFPENGRLRRAKPRPTFMFADRTRRKPRYGVRLPETYFKIGLYSSWKMHVYLFCPPAVSYFHILGFSLERAAGHSECYPCIRPASRLRIIKYFAHPLRTRPAFSQIVYWSWRRERTTFDPDGTAASDGGGPRGGG